MAITGANFCALPRSSSAMQSSSRSDPVTSSFVSTGCTAMPLR
jgi:hypothetical protein